MRKIFQKVPKHVIINTAEQQEDGKENLSLLVEANQFKKIFKQQSGYNDDRLRDNYLPIVTLLLSNFFLQCFRFLCVHVSQIFSSQISAASLFTKSAIQYSRCNFSTNK